MQKIILTRVFWVEGCWNGPCLGRTGKVARRPWAPLIVLEFAVKTCYVLDPWKNLVVLSGVRRKCSWEVWFRVIWWSFAFGVRCLWRQNLTPFPCFQTTALAKFVDIICIFFYIHSPYFMCRCTEYKLSALQVGLSEKNKLNATTQQFITAKISGCALKQGWNTLITSNLQLQNQAAPRSRQIRAVEHWRFAAGLAGVHPGLQDRMLLKRIKYARKCLFFVMYRSP